MHETLEYHILKKKLKSSYLIKYVSQTIEVFLIKINLAISRRTVQTHLLA
jgi:hypothetical protein